MSRRSVPDVPNISFLMSRHLVPDVPNRVPDVPKPVPDIPTSRYSVKGDLEIVNEVNGVRTASGEALPRLGTLGTSEIDSGRWLGVLARMNAPHETIECLLVIVWDAIGCLVYPCVEVGLGGIDVPTGEITPHEADSLSGEILK
jgi:hypothetical protein